MDKFYVYRPLLDLFGHTEGTDKGRGYNETLAYGAFTGGDVDLVSMTLDQVDALQTKMLKHPKNSMNSSAAGRFQIVRTTRRDIQENLGIPGSAKFDAGMQDQMACYLLGVRGIDKYLAGRLKENTLINNLAKEWASIPTTSGKGHYDGQNAAVPVSRVRAVLAEVKRRHAEGQPTETVTVPVPVDKPVVPSSVEKEVRQKTNWLAWILGLFGTGGAGASWLKGMDSDGLILIGGATLLFVVVMLLGGEWIIRRIRSIKKAIEE